MFNDKGKYHDIGDQKRTNNPSTGVGGSWNDSGGMPTIKGQSTPPAPSGSAKPTDK